MINIIILNKLYFNINLIYVDLVNSIDTNFNFFSYIIFIFNKIKY